MKLTDADYLEAGRERRTEEAARTLRRYFLLAGLKLDRDMESEIVHMVECIIEAAIAGMEARLLRDKE